MFIVNSEFINATPSISVMFVKQLPIMFPSVRSMCPFFVESILVDSSGRLVPSAIIVAPITISGIPMLLAM